MAHSLRLPDPFTLAPSACCAVDDVRPTGTECAQTAPVLHGASQEPTPPIGEDDINLENTRLLLRKERRGEENDGRKTVE